MNPSLINSTGAFLQGELERFDSKIYEPLSDYTWGRDIPLRSDVTIADEATSFALAEYAFGASGASGSNKAWATQSSGAIPTVGVSLNKKITPVTPWAMEVGYDVYELAKAMQVGRPIDQQKLNAVRIRHHRDIDEMVYVGDKIVGVKGLVNSEDVPKTNIGSLATLNSQEKILDAINEALNLAFKNTNQVVIPSKLLLPTSMGTALSKVLAIQGTPLAITLKQWLQENSILSTYTNKPLEIEFCRWLNKENSGLTHDRVVAYIDTEDYCRLPLVTLQNTPVQFTGLTQKTVYYGAIGGVEILRPEAFIYGDLTD